ncbi:YjeF domain-containing protein [Pochonia chlamydosporia 170]|uniref:ATP-dependent (S)-NAD(P)H-hydrate dehydratase n=1 Tax=Pochonia chlamydosporia 170 TaxID=1380566 RepID=A0A179G5W2_METCM|nr:YjeF domain-containing protein [Pochonia chlamydosporia 170]OAQ72743.1 YjeF domain-containing protein [Pochonia chlamydosporia 170]
MVTADNEPNMSVQTRGILSKVRQMIPPMLDKFHKGQLGRVAVIGGSQDYTGAPYFSAMASARLGCDMSHVICTPEAAAVIKTYSPNLMVHPLMRQTPADDETSKPDADKVSASIIEMLPRLHVLVVGPGLGRDPLMHDTVSRVIRAAKERKMPVVMDADALQIIQKDPGLVKGYSEVVLTPNVVEFKRLWDSLGLKDPGAAKETDKVEALAKALDGVTIIQKGQKDFISNGTVTLVNDLEGGKKRSGGQGDTLTGSVATFLAWRKAYLDGIWDRGDELAEDELLGLAAFGGSAITRESSRLAFLKQGRSLQASDLTDEVHGALMGLFGEVDGDAGPKL